MALRWLTVRPNGADHPVEGGSIHVVVGEKALKVMGTPDVYEFPRLSPDGKRLIVSRTDSSGNTNLWQLEFARDLLTRFTFDASKDVTPVWSPDGRQSRSAESRKSMVAPAESIARYR